MITGIGIDIVEIDRIEKILSEKREGFLHKIFAEDEIELLEERGMRAEYVAGRFAAKEAVSKALGTGIRGFSFSDIVVYNDELGKPYVVLSGKAADLISGHGSSKIHLSISHGQHSAIAYAVIEEAD